MKLLFSMLIFLSLMACGSNKDLNVYADYVEVVSNADSTINELSAISDSEELNRRLNARFQSVSENKSLISKIPEKRIEEKSELLETCKLHFDSCDYVPEGYSFATNRNFLNLKYQYNGFGSYDLYYKHAVIDLATARRVLYLNMFVDPSQVLENYNAKYVKEYEDYLARFERNELIEDELNEYDAVRNHLNSRAPFEFEDLNNFELFYDEKEQQFTEIRFHYNGTGGVYKAILSEGYISFTLKELDAFLLKDFKNQLKKK